MSKIIGYWFSADGAVENKSGRHTFAVGQTYHVDGDIVPCRRGLHGSEHPSDALSYARGDTLDLVELSGTVVPHGSPTNKYAASTRRHIARIDARELLYAHARWCALQAAHLWNMPTVVRQYLETGDETKRDAAWAAARDASFADARVAAVDAAVDAARDAAWAAARDAAWDASRDAAWDASMASARDAQRNDLLHRVQIEFDAAREGLTC